MNPSPPAETFARRWERLRATLTNGQVLLFRGDAPFFEDLYYLTGLATYHVAWLGDVETGRGSLWTWGVEGAEVAERVANVDELRVHDDPWTGAVQELARRGGQVYVGVRCERPVEVLRPLLLAHVAGDVSARIGALRAIKDEWELGQLAQARDIAAAVMRSVRQELVAGVSEREVAAAIVSALARRGAVRPSMPIVAFGANTACPHHLPTGRLLAPGDVVLIDIYGEVAGHYCSEHTDTFVFDGEVPAVQSRLDAVERATAAVGAVLQSGRTLREAERMAGEVLGAAGFADEYPGVCAHDVGLSEHDPTDKDVAVVPGRVIAVEPSVYSRDLGLGVRRERIVVA